MDVSQLYGLFLTSTGVSIDTRTIQKGNIFFAINGENFDGNLYAEKAIKEGALFSIVDDVSFVSENCLYVKDSLIALQELASFHREKLGIPILAITGSNGKTTSKELCAAVLETTYKVTCTVGNLNNHLGVPLTLLAFNKSTELGIIEMGANHVGEIEVLCKIAKPNFGLITNIGKAHIGEFGGFENIIKAKGELYDYLAKTNGKIIYDSTDDLLSKRAENVDNKTSYKDLLINDFDLSVFQMEPDIVLNLGGLSIKTVLGGGHNVKNLITCIAVARLFNVSSINVKLSLEAFKAPLNRSQWINTKRNKIFLDAYNANPSSMESAITYFASIEGEKVCILGEMLELGEYSENEHKKLMQLAESKNMQCYFIGESFKDFNKYNIFNSKSDFLENINLPVLKNKMILIKASRGMKLESILDFV